MKYILSDKTCAMNRSSNNVMKVDDIKSMISTLSLQEIYTSFTSIIDKIFNTENIDTYWDIISRNSYKNDNDKILDFLSPNGQLFDLILKRLTIDKSVIHFEFPICRLSKFTQNAIANNSACIFISSKLYSKTHGLQSNVLFLNAFEYFVFSFISFIYHKNVTKKLEWNGSTDSIYCQLVLRYLDFFFFKSPQSNCLMQLALQSRSRANLNQSFSWNAPLNGSFQPQQNLSNSNSEWNMFNPRSRLAGGKEQKNSIDTAELYYTETMLQVISEFWLNSTIIEPVNGNAGIIGGASCPSSVIIDQYDIDSNCRPSWPSVDQVCLVRLLVKHCYHFSYAKSVTALSPDSQLECEFLSKLHSYRQQIVPRFLLSRMLPYLEACFRNWPIDFSFKIVMETWLSLVQPWRYVDSYQHTSDQLDQLSNCGTSGTISGAISGTSSVAVIGEDWCEFVHANCEIYTQPLALFVNRLQRMDLAVPRNAHMMFRVAKVIGQGDIGRFLAASIDSRYHRTGQSIDPIWNDIRYQVSLVFAEIGSLVARLELADQSAGVQNSWWRAIWDSFINSDTLSVSGNPKRVAMSLRQSRSLFAGLLGINECAGIDEIEGQRLAERQDFLDHKHSQADHVITAGRVQLTDFGRFQVVNKLCKLDVPSNIDYYNRPTCSFEVDGLVRLSRMTSNTLCRRFELPMRSCCYRSDFWGRLSRYILIGKWQPINSQCDDVTDRDVQLKEWVDSNPLHLRLRFLATKAFLFWFFVLYLVLRFTHGSGIISMVIGGALLYVMVAMVSVIILRFS